MVLVKLDGYMQTQDELMSEIFVSPIKILEENIGSKISDTFHSNIFSDKSFQQGKQKKK